MQGDGNDHILAELFRIAHRGDGDDFAGPTSFDKAVRDDPRASIGVGKDKRLGIGPLGPEDVCVGEYRHALECARGVARPEGLEPPAYRFEVCRSIQLSYGRVLSWP